LRHKFSIPVSSLSKDNISGILQSKTVPAEIVSELLDTLDKCEYERFAPAGSASRETVFERTVSIISKIEQSA
jgi:hypothetical protein